jgi:hypothetical protein
MGGFSFENIAFAKEHDSENPPDSGVLRFDSCLRQAYGIYSPAVPVFCAEQHMQKHPFLLRFFNVLPLKKAPFDASSPE